MRSFNATKLEHNKPIANLKQAKKPIDKNLTQKTYFFSFRCNGRVFYESDVSTPARTYSISELLNIKMMKCGVDFYLFCLFVLFYSAQKGLIGLADLQALAEFQNR